MREKESSNEQGCRLIATACVDVLFHLAIRLCHCFTRVMFALRLCMQGAFVLLSTTGQVSIVILLVMMAALAAYIIWRFWEGLAGQGYDDT